MNFRENVSIFALGGWLAGCEGGKTEDTSSNQHINGLELTVRFLTVLHAPWELYAQILQAFRLWMTPPFLGSFSDYNSG